MPYKGLAPARQNKTITVPEVTFMVPDLAGTPTVRDDFGTDGGGLSNPQDWSSHDSDGRTVQSSSALTGESAMLSRTFMPAYDLMPNVLRNIMGLPISDVTVDGATRRLRTWVDPEFGAPAIETLTAYHGPEGDPVRLTGGKTQQWSLDVARSSNGGTCGGNIDIEFNRYQDGFGLGYVAPDGSTAVAAAGTTTAQFTVVVAPTGNSTFTLAGNNGASFAFSPSNNLTLTASMTAAQALAATPTYTGITASVYKGEGYFVITYTRPTNTSITLTKTGTGAFSVYLGDTGGIPYFTTPTGQVTPTGQFMEPNHFLLYIAANDAELAAIDWSLRPDAYGNASGVHMLTDATRSTFQMSDLWKLHYGFNGKRYATDMVPGARSTTLSITVPRDRTTGSDYRFLKDTEKDCQATGFYLVRRFLCGVYEMRQTIWVGRSEAMGFEIDNEIDMATFALTRRRNITVNPSHKIELWTPV